MSAEEIKSLNKKRGTVKARQTIFIKYLDSIHTIIENEGYTGVNKTILLELESRLSKFENLLEEFNEIQTLLENIDENLDNQIMIREIFENDFYKSMARSKFIINHVQDLQNEGEQDRLSVTSQNSSNLSSQVALTGIRLPKINLNKFSGSPEGWLEFRDTYESLIHKNSDLSDIQKYHYLRSSLEGSAKQIIASLEFTAANYVGAWKLLFDRYNNKRLLINNHLKPIFHFTKINSESSSDIQKMIDTISKHLQALKSIEIDVENWDLMIIYVMSSKLDDTSAREWQEYKLDSDVPTLDEFKSFLRTKANVLEALEANRKQNHNHNQNQCKSKYIPQNQKQKYIPTTNNNTNSFVSTQVTCSFCKENHAIFNCSKFLQLPIYSRIENVRKLKLCHNCLRSNHMTDKCYVQMSCRLCNARHNSLLHINTQSIHQSSSNSNSVPNADNVSNTHERVGAVVNTQNDGTQSLSLSCQTMNQVSEILLSTALVQVMDIRGNSHKCRILLDSGSQSSLITYKLCDKLGLPKTPIEFAVSGIGQAISQIEHKCSVTIQSYHNEFRTTVSCLVIPEISQRIPQTNLAPVKNLPLNIRLADPSYFQPSSIDILIGAELFYNLLCVGQVALGEYQPILQKTRLGWIISGPIMSSVNDQHSNCFLSTHLDIQSQLSKFWELEECSSSVQFLSVEEQQCETLFKETTARAPNGQFIVQIPFKELPTCLGESKQRATKQFHSIEVRLQNNSKLRKMYTDFMLEYQQLGHMSKVEAPDDNSQDTDEISYFLPHHGVLKEDSSTTKLRVVFNGSAPSSSGWSLNQLQMTGPKIQDDLIDILLRFRKHSIVISADIEKMYRQILIHPNQRSLQKILWRNDPSHELETFTLNTVTYGTTSAPFLAVRCIKQLGLDFLEIHHQAAQTILQDFYVDDLLSGADTIDQAIQLSKEISSILSSAKFNLRKWQSNSPEILKALQISDEPSEMLHIGKQENTKTLGLFWSSTEDCLMYKIGIIPESKVISKRSILSDVSQVFDPLGLLSPCIILAKILLQNLWRYKLSWDESIPSALHTEWKQFRYHLPLLNSLKIPRRVICQNSISIELHGFADASMHAYGSCIYIRSRASDGTISVQLLCAKSKVAPLKCESIPRLELCAAVLLAKLVTKVKSALNIDFGSLYLWSDSSVTLCWIKTEPCNLQQFVANRVAQIQSMTNPDEWRHVGSKDNPADVLSRGVNPNQLAELQIWWSGPPWLISPKECWPNTSYSLEGDIPELKKEAKILNIKNHQEFLFTRYSSFIRLKRVTSYILRFLNNTRYPNNKKLGPLKAEECAEALIYLIKLSQSESFGVEINALAKGEKLSPKNHILSLSPFLDERGILRVGGRLQMSEYSFEKKHPALLSSKHSLTKLIFTHEHIRLFHAGPQLLLSSIRDTYWPLAGRNLARKTIHSCIKCHRLNHQTLNPIMGMLPKSRLQPSLPFHVTGVDYAGPFIIKDKAGRGAKRIKCYICLFICFSTKAIHLEPVTSLSTEAFLAVFRRFVSRRGKPLHVYSDNGSNFIGAKSELKELGTFLLKDDEKLSDIIATEGVNWHFIPPHSPHFGGLWEAGVKSSKYHLKRVASNALLTFEEFLTTITQIEAIVNSRPISPLTSDPSDLEPLTPGHFLIGRRLTALPDPDLQDIKINRLSRFQLIQRLQQHFWSRWTKECLSEMQQKQKWKTHQLDLKVGDMVLIKTDNQPPLQWPLGRVVSIYPGQDGVARVASILTKTGIIKRSFSKICVLPVRE